MKQQTDIYIKITTETDAEKDSQQIIDELSTEIISGCQVFSDMITAPVEILDIVEEGEIHTPPDMPMSKRQKQALLNVLNYLADEEQHFYEDPDTQENHIWLDREVLRVMYEGVAPAKPLKKPTMKQWGIMAVSLDALAEFEVDDEQLKALNSCTPIMKAGLSLLSALIEILPYAECEVEYRHEQGKDCEATKAEWDEAYPRIVYAQELIKTLNSTNK